MNKQKTGSVEQPKDPLDDVKLLAAQGLTSVAISKGLDVTRDQLFGRIKRAGTSLTKIYQDLTVDRTKQMMGEGKDRAEIAKSLGISPNTVTHRLKGANTSIPKIMEEIKSKKPEAVPVEKKPDRMPKIREMAGQGLTSHQMAQELGVSRWTVFDQFRGTGTSLGRLSIDVTVDRAKAMLAKDKDPKDIAKSLGVSEHTVESRLRKAWTSLGKLKEDVRFDKRMDSLQQTYFGPGYQVPGPEYDRRSRIRKVMRDLWKSNGSQKVIEVFEYDELSEALGKRPRSGKVMNLFASIADTIADDSHGIFSMVPKDDKAELKDISKRWFTGGYNTSYPETDVIRNALKKVKG